MKIALLGYGKMGKEIEKIALSRHHEIVLKIDITNFQDLTTENLNKADVAIDFSHPGSAYNNILRCFESNTPVVCGTTGWLDKFNEVTAYCIEHEKTFFYASNYSIGVNLFFKLNQHLAKMMNKFDDYEVVVNETHHIHKLDAPSGTAITLAEGLIKNIDRKKKWVLGESHNPNEISIVAHREGEIPGIHDVRYQSEVDFIEIKHSAYSRQGFALGAVIAAEFIHNKTGYFTMDHLMNAE